jgi:hypothetical protein
VWVELSFSQPTANAIWWRTHVSATSVRLGSSATCIDHRTALGVAGCQTAGAWRTIEGCHLCSGLKQTSSWKVQELTFIKPKYRLYDARLFYWIRQINKTFVFLTTDFHFKKRDLASWSRPIFELRRAHMNFHQSHLLNIDMTSKKDRKCFL